ncbi:hypothetical protein PVAND_015272 [Polypedilum vanderplanki]|uniref:TEP1-F n=1 Tax=Polypedilum vanderplanki TaxID=319348 RepID=A0A9J6BCI9_POLVA|nr:hypothetical protein PVAND_015272 [Polypedilum vanderplanki]
MKALVLLLFTSVVSAKILIEKWDMQLDPEYAEVKYNIKDKTFINVDAHALKEADDVILDAAVYSKVEDKYNPFVRPEPIHICTVHQNDDPLIKFIHDEIIQYGNVTKACPVQKNSYYYLHDFAIDASKFPMDIPTGEFRIDINGSIMDQGKIHHIYSKISFCDESKSEGFFTIVGSNLIKFRENYRASVVYKGYDKETSLQLKIKLKERERNENYEVTKNVTLSGSGVQNVDFELKDQPEGNFVLEVTGDNFTRFEKLHINDKKSSTFIQTDKATYKPSDLVRFRILMLDSEMRPYLLPDFVKFEVFITDGGDNRVKQFDNIKFNKFGVLQGEMQLSDSPVLGTWKIHLKFVGVDTETVKTFDVAEYVLPKFEVSIDANPDANFKDGKIRATVKAKYTFGKIAKGNATVTAEVSPRYRWWGHRQEDIKKVSKTVKVDGKEFVEFDIKEDLGMEEGSYLRHVTLTASFTEELSGKEANATTQVEVHETRHKIELTKDDGEKIKPGLPYRVTAHVKYHDRDMPVTDKHNPIVFNISYYYDVPRTCKRRIWNQPWRPYHREIVIEDSSSNDDETTTTVEPTTTESATSEIDSETATLLQPVIIKPNITKEEPKYEEYECREEKSNEKQVELFLKNGKATISLEILSNTTRLQVKAKYLETTNNYFHINRAESESDNYIQAKLISKSSLNDQMSIEVLSNNEIKELNYQIFGKGNLVEAKTISFPTTKKYTLTFKPTAQMLPIAKVIIYYFTADGEIISDHLIIEFGNELENYIDLSLSKETAKPGEDFEISVKTKPNSFVGLLGVDQSVLLLKSGNDIEASVVNQEIKEYNEVTKYNYEWFERHYDYYVHYEDFQKGDVIIITNAKKQFERPYIPYYYNFEETDYEHHALAYDSDSAPVPESANFPIMKTTSHRMGIAPALAGPPTTTTSHLIRTGGGGMTSAAKPIEIRKEFPETFIWDTFEFDNSSISKILSKKVPDTITSWIITGFSIDPLTGLGLTKQPTKLNVFQPFFVSTNLPYSIKRGEVVSVPIVVFNYLDSDQTAKVTLYNKDHEFEFVNVADDENKLSRRRRALETERTKSVEIKSNDGTAVSFMIRPLKVGHITIKVVAESSVAGDGLERQLKVEPEGITQYKNEAIFIDLRNDSKFDKEIEIVVPENAVSDSTKIEASAIGDILGPTIENLNKLIRMPYGCGEQNMLNFKLKKNLKSIWKLAIKKNSLTCTIDGSSAFGKSDKSGSTWLTSFVARSFNQAAKYIHVDKEKVSKALDFLASVQVENGSFPEIGHVSHKDMQGGSSKGIALTAYTLITFLENKDANEKYKTTIDKAMNYVIDNMNQLNDNYSLAIASYAMQLAKHDKSEIFLTKLQSQAETKDGVKFWSKEQPKDEENDQFYSRWRQNQVNSVNVEMSAYALQALLEAGQESEAVPIMKWLVTQRNANGGFQSTQDTVVGLQALSRLATRIYVPNSEISITVKSKSNNKAQAQMTLNAGNALVLQKQELPSNERHFEVEATGKGFSILQISYKYNIDDSGKFPRFTLKPKVEEASNKEFLQLSVCTSFVPDTQAEKSNMAVMELKDQPEGNFVLEVTGDNFTRFEKLHINDKKSSTFIQTDKATYKPSDLVRFRILILDSEMRPYLLPDFVKFEVFITDGGDNRVKQFDNVKFNKFGVLQGEMQLSDSPVLGTWKIHLKFVGVDTETVKTFDVAEYVLPKFEVSIDANPDANFKDGKIRATVKAKYTFGKIAKGNATVTAEVSPRYRWWGHRQEVIKKVSKTVKVDGKEFVEFDIKEDLGMEEGSYLRHVTLTASFTEELSGKEANATTQVEVHETRHKIELTKDDGEKIKPGLPYRVTAHVKYHDRDMPVTDKHNPIVFNISYYYDVPRTCKRRIWNQPWRPYHREIVIEDSSSNDDETTTTVEPTTTESATSEIDPETATLLQPVIIKPNITKEEPKYEEYECREEKSNEKQVELFLKNGKATISLEILSNTTRLQVKAKYLETTNNYFHINRAESESDNYIQAKLISKPSLNDQMSIEVLSNNEIKELNYQIFGKGNLVEAKTISFPTTNKYTLTFKPTAQMLPIAKVIIYYFTTDGEIISDHLSIEFGNELENYIDLKLSKETAKPGEDFEIFVKTKPNSFVGLLGVDQSVLLLKSGNDIEASVVNQEIKEYNEVTKYNYEWYERHYDYYLHYEDFQKGDGIIITNAKKQFERPYIPYYYSFEETDYEHHALAYDSDSAPVPESANFPIMKTTSHRMGIAPALAGPPTTTTSHLIRTGGGGMTSAAKPIEIRKEFPETFIWDTLEFDNSSISKILSKKVPDTITSWIITGFSIDPLTGLVVSIPIVVFNYLDSDQTAKVTLYNKDHEFEFVNVADDENKLSRRRRALETERTKSVEIKSNDGTAVSFMIRPLKVGHITIKVVAESSVAGDGLERQLKVEPEGITQYKNEAIFIDLRNDSKSDKEIEIVVPENAVSDSTKIEASAIGDILGPTIENLNKLIRMPYGCELPSNERHFEVEATGKGFSILQISYKYNIDDSGKFPRFTLKPKVEEASNKEFLQLSVCTSFVPDAQAEKSNMAIMEVTLPSGFTFDSDSLAELLATDRVKKVETKEGETIVMVYFDDIDSKEICPVFKAYRTHAVAKQKPAPVVIYDYYDTTRHARSFYNPPEVSLCDICQGEAECKNSCEVEEAAVDEHL